MAKETEKTNQEKEEEIDQKLEDLEVAVEAEVTEKVEEAAAEGEEKGPIALFLDSQQVKEQLASLRGVAETGLEKTQKNVIIFYEQATKAGDRVRGFLYLLVGLSIFFAGILATSKHYFTFKELLAAIGYSLVGRIFAAAVGISLIAFGMSKMFAGVVEGIQARRKRKKPKYVQRKLTE